MLLKQNNLLQFSASRTLPFVSSDQSYNPRCQKFMIKVKSHILYAHRLLIANKIFVITFLFYKIIKVAFFFFANIKCIA